MKKTVTVVVPEWVGEEEVRLWIVEGMGRKLVKRLGRVVGGVSAQREGDRTLRGGQGEGLEEDS